jgi:K+-transporting ATPase KdpF subunit
VKQQSKKAKQSEETMSAESAIMLLVSAATMIYLIYALLRPEKF